MKMADVCNVFYQAGMKNVTSVLASGNILFDASAPPDQLKTILEEAMSSHFQYEAFLFIKTAQEVEQIYTNNPFSPKEHFHVYAFVGVPKAENLLIQEFEKSQTSEGEHAQVVNHTFYWQTPKGQTLISDFGKILGKPKLKNQFTSRNINTFEKILKKLKT